MQLLKSQKVSAEFADEFWCVIVEYTNNATRDTYKLYKTLYRQNVTWWSDTVNETTYEIRETLQAPPSDNLGFFVRLACALACF